MNITRIRINGLYGKDFDIPIVDNKIILLGLNGTCKSAILKLVSSCFSERNVKNHNFDKMIITVNNLDYTFVSVDGFVHGHRIPVDNGADVLYVTNKYMVDIGAGEIPLVLNEANKKEFIKTINRYFLGSDKKIESIPDIDFLSDGEKKLARIFYRLFHQGKRIIFFDDIEVNLSIEWQKNFLSDIWNTGKCSFLMAVTHSPFVFENDLEEYAQDIESFCKKVKSHE